MLEIISPDIFLILLKLTLIFYAWLFSAYTTYGLFSGIFFH